MRPHFGWKREIFKARSDRGRSTDATKQQTNQTGHSADGTQRHGGKPRAGSDGPGLPTGPAAERSRTSGLRPPRHYRARDSPGGVSQPPTAPHTPCGPTRGPRLTSHRRGSAQPRPARPRHRPGLGGSAGRPLTAVPQGGLRAAGVQPPGRHPPIHYLNLARVFWGNAPIRLCGTAAKRRCTS